MTLPASIISFLNKNPIFVQDAGARNGFSDFPQLAKWMTVHAYEADAEEAKKLQLLKHPFQSFTVYPFALGGKEEKRIFHFTRKKSFSSFLEFDEKEFDKYFGRMKNAPEWKKCFEIEKSVEISITTLDLEYSELFPEHVLKTTSPFIDFLKLDTQGTELEILNGARGLLESKMISVIKTEVNLQPVYKGQPEFSAIDQFLRKNGYLLVDYKINQHAFPPYDANDALVENVHPGNGGDAVYVVDFNLSSDFLRSDRAMTAALLLAHKGYLSVAEYLLKTFTDTKPENIDVIFSALNQKTSQEKRKNFARKWLPPGLIAKLK